MQEHSSFSGGAVQVYMSVLHSSSSVWIEWRLDLHEKITINYSRFSLFFRSVKCWIVSEANVQVHDQQI